MKKIITLVCCISLILIISGCNNSTDKEQTIYFKECGHEVYVETERDEHNYIGVSSVCIECASANMYEKGKQEGYKEALEDVREYLYDMGYEEEGDQIKDDLW